MTRRGNHRPSMCNRESQEHVTSRFKRRIWTLGRRRERCFFVCVVGPFEEWRGCDDSCVLVGHSISPSGTADCHRNCLWARVAARVGKFSAHTSQCRLRTSWFPETVHLARSTSPSTTTVLLEFVCGHGDWTALVQRSLIHFPSGYRHINKDRARHGRHGGIAAPSPF